MSEQTHSPAVQKTEMLISNLLRIGVTTSLLIVVAGTVLSFVHHPEYLSKSSDELTKITGKSASFPHTLSQIFEGVTQFRGAPIVMLGLLLLIATPIMRVAISIVAFVIQKDRVFVAITTTVFILLLLSFFLGKSAG